MLLSGITSLGKTVLLVVAITFIVWAIVTAIFVPKRNPGFPRRLDAYILVSAILFVAQMSAVVWVSETQEAEEAHAAEGAAGGGEGALRLRLPAEQATLPPARKCSRAPAVPRATPLPTPARAERSGLISTPRSRPQRSSSSA